MSKNNRREFLKTIASAGIGAAGLSAALPKKVIAGPPNIISNDRMGVLVDTTVCIGCRKCEWSCKISHGIPSGDMTDYENKDVFHTKRRPNNRALTVVNRYERSQNIFSNIKFQCMHCDHPACVSACIVGAFSKQENGSVVWDTDKCIGCRYCMVACPWQVPAFEFDKALNPRIMKCDFCWDRTQEGKLPACIEICPVEAITYGKREDLLIEAKKRIKNRSDKYFNHILGEFEVGGTDWLYLGANDLTGDAFPKLGNNPAPGVSESIQHGIFAYFIPPIALYALLGGIMWLSKDKDLKEDE